MATSRVERPRRLHFRLPLPILQLSPCGFRKVSSTDRKSGFFLKHPGRIRKIPVTEPKLQLSYHPGAVYSPAPLTYHVMRMRGVVNLANLSKRVAVVFCR